MDDLIAFLRARLDAQAQQAEAACHGGDGVWALDTLYGESGRIEDPSRGEVVVYDEGSPTAEQAAHIIEHGPARVLADIALKQRILEAHGGSLGEQPMFCVHCEHDTPCPTLRLLAAVYEAHPDYRPEWAPTA